MRREIRNGHDAQLVRFFHAPYARRYGRGRQPQHLGDLLVGCAAVEPQLIDDRLVGRIEADSRFHSPSFAWRSPFDGVRGSRAYVNPAIAYG